MVTRENPKRGQKPGKPAPARPRKGKPASKGPRNGKSNGALDFGVLDGFVGFQLHKARNVAATELRHDIAPEMLPGHFPILYLIERNPGCTQSAIAQAVGLDRSSLVPILNRFERHGWITRRVAAADRRAHAVALTKAGQGILAGLSATVGALEERISAALGSAGQPEMLRLLHRFQAAFE